MPDGKRKRRHSRNRAKNQWYARYRALRFGRRFGQGSPQTGSAVTHFAGFRLASS